MRILRATLLGSNVDASRSPLLHTLLFPLLKTKCESPFEKIEFTLTSCRTEKDLHQYLHSPHRLRGANVTIPYKATIQKILTARSEIAAVSNSVNTLRFTRDNIEGFSTDGLGFSRAITREDLLPLFSRSELFIIGAGGAARAIIHSLAASASIKKIHVVNRSFGRAEELIDSLPSSIESFCLTFEKFLHIIPTFQAPRIIINTTPLGSQDTQEVQETKNILSALAHLTPQDHYIDITTRPQSSLLLHHAQNRGVPSHDGLGMLIEQGALSQWLWMTKTKSEDEIPELLSNEEYHSIRKELLHS